MLFSAIDWPGIERLRARIEKFRSNDLESAAQDFAGLFVEEFEEVVLARVFAVLPYAVLPAAERAFADGCVGGDPSRLSPRTPVLTLLGTRGTQPEWNSRKLSNGHLAIPLLDRSFVQGAPMIAKLLADLEIELRELDGGLPIATRQMLGARNGTF